MARWGVQRRLDVLVAVVVVGLLVTVWVVRPRTTLDIDDPSGVVADAEMFTDLVDGEPPDVDADFGIHAGAASCPHYGGELEVDLSPDGIVELSWQAEGRGGCDDSCEFIWVTGSLTPDFRDAELRLRGLVCGTWEVRENVYSGR
ncbi:MAG: hypothetical protein AAF480_15180 [Actinomycetota bacterium]